MTSRSSFDLVVIAASAGGIQALGRVLSEVPADYPVPIAVVQHRSTRYPDRLAAVLSRKARLPVSRALAGERVEPGRVYLAPPGLHLVIRPGAYFALTDGRKIHHLHSAADPLMISAAQVFGSRVLAIVLTGGDSDGSEGVLAVKAAGGTVIAQNEATSQCFGMPGSAIQTGAVDYVLALEEIGPALVSLADGHSLEHRRLLGRQDAHR